MKLLKINCIQGYFDMTAHETLFPEELNLLVIFYKVNLKNNNIEAILSVSEPNKWLIGKMLDNGGFHVISEYIKYDEKLKVI